MKIDEVKDDSDIIHHYETFLRENNSYLKK